MGKSVSYHSYLMQALKDPKRAEGYIEAALEENDLELLQDIVNDVIEAIGDRPDFEALQKAKQVTKKGERGKKMDTSPSPKKS